MNAVEPRLIVVTDVSVAPEGVLEGRVERLVTMSRPGSVMVQLRDNALPARQRLALGARLVALCRRHAQYFAVNDRLDIAALLGADCVHLGEDAVSVEDARRVLGDGIWVSRACHRAEDAATSGSDAVLLSPIAQARKGRPALGVAGLGAARAAVERARAARSDVSAHAESRRPLVYALGGVDAANAAECLAAGADGVAVIRAALDRRPIEPLLDALGIAK